MEEGGLLVEDLRVGVLGESTARSLSLRALEDLYEEVEGVSVLEVDCDLRSGRESSSSSEYTRELFLLLLRLEGSNSSSSLIDLEEGPATSDCALPLDLELEPELLLPLRREPPGSLRPLELLLLNMTARCCCGYEGYGY